MLISSIFTSFPIFSSSFLFCITLFLVAVIISSAVPPGLLLCSNIVFNPNVSDILPLFVSNFALFALSNNPVLVNACIDIVASINNMIIAIINAINVIAFS